MLTLSMISFSLYFVFAHVGSAVNHVRFLAISLMFKEKKIFAQACFTVLSHSLTYLAPVCTELFSSIC